MSKTTINNLPAELITNILSRVVDDQRTRNNALLTCKLWKQIIDSSHSWSAVLISHGINVKFLDFLSTTTRGLRSIKIYGLGRNTHNIAKEIFKRHGSTIREVTLIYGFMDNFNDFLDMFKFLPKLEKLTLSRFHCPMADDTLVESDLPTMLKLTTLDFFDADYSVLKCFTKSNIKTFIFRNVQNQCRSLQESSMTDFLQSQPNLTSIVFKSINPSLLVGDMPFKLTKLSLEDMANIYDFNHLLTFMKYHTKTMKELELGCTFPNAIYEFVLSNFEQIKSLKLSCNDIPREIAFYQKLKANGTIVNLVLMESPAQRHLQDGSSESFNELFNLLPNLVKVSLLTYQFRAKVPFLPERLKDFF